MIFRRLSLLFFLSFSAFSVALAAGDDTLKSLFMFQQKMAESGITSAMMKMGEMYEKGEGIEKSNINALKMYQQAQAAGDKKAANAIKRLKNQNANSNKTTKVNIPKVRTKPNQSPEALRQQQAQAAARTKTLKIAKDKARRERIQKQKRAKAKTRKLKAAKLKAKAARDAKLRAAKSKAFRKEKALRAAKKAKENKKLTQAVNNVIPKTDYEEEEEIVSIETNVAPDETPEKGFKSDPCKSKAARLLSICR